jgi:sterol desaturase/sphingolipid hydroxylase (fatty acid hydroxylase superfamily)
MAGRVSSRQEQETHHERVDRELIELLNELRVALPGVQVLFAFLLTVPFTQRFGRTTEIQRDIYFVTLILAGLSSALLIAPSSQHRLLFRKQDKEALLFRSNRYAIAGLICLGAALCSAVLLVAAFLFSTLVAVLASAGLGAVMIWLWIVLPLLRRLDDKEDRAKAK